MELDERALLDAEAMQRPFEMGTVDDAIDTQVLISAMYDVGNARQRRAMRLRLAGYTLIEAGRILGVTPERVRQINLRLVNKYLSSTVATSGRSLTAIGIWVR